MNSTTRRRILLGGMSGVAVGAGWLHYRKPQNTRESVFIARNQRYDGDLKPAIAEGLIATGLKPPLLKGKRVLLKPNMVEPVHGLLHITTHPAVVVAAAEVFRAWGAEVAIGEGPGHLRDTSYALAASGIADALLELKIPFSDLNYEDTRYLPFERAFSKLPGVYLPKSVLEADLVVTIPKMKTHHWVGMTGAMKNMYGVFPGIVYGWPKNVLHFNGIPQTVCDINSKLPSVAIVDGIVGMEGDGPIMGTPVPAGLLVVGTNAMAVDATLCRLMDLRPQSIPYLSLGAEHLGPISSESIQQEGEQLGPLVRPFEIHNAPHLTPLVAHRRRG